MVEYLPVFAGAFAAAAVVLSGGEWFRRAAWRIGLIDRPKLRGVHAQPVARAGGMTIAAALVAAVLVQMVAARILGSTGYLGEIDYLYLLLPALLLMGVGMIDDIRPMGAKSKLVVQSGCAVVAWFLGFRIEEIGLLGMATVDVGVLSLPMTVVFIVALINAFNMIDGVDGLCAGAASVALAGMCAFAMLGGQVEFALVLPLAVAALAFLRWNFGKPKTFLGDSGSMLLGFFVATASLRAANVGGTLQVAPLFLLISLPVVDITVAFFRRLIQGANPLQADRGHIHHILMLLTGGNSRLVPAILLAMASVGVAGGFLGLMQPWAAAPAAMAVIGLYTGVYAAGGYLSWHNLRAAGPATHLASSLAEITRESGAFEALDREELIGLMQAAGITAMGLYHQNDRRVWGIGIMHPRRETLTLPLYAAGRVRCGVLHLQGTGRAGTMAFAAHLLHPLYPTFMEVLDIELPAIPETVKIPA